MPHHPTIPPPPKPTRIFFDPFNSSSTGHQVAPSLLAGSTSWRQSRTHKLSHQFRDASGRGGDAHLSDLVGAGSKNWLKDGRKENGNWEKGAPGLREKGWQDITKLMNGSRKRSHDDDLSKDEDKKTTKKNRHVDAEEEAVNKAITTTSHSSKPPPQQDKEINTSHPQPPTASHTSPSSSSSKPTTTSHLPPPQIFTSLTIYLNGSTAPLISDHRLKSLIALHGGTTSLSLSRRTVTHVILGSNSNSNSNSSSFGAGGGLASSKIQKEIQRVRGKGIKYVTAQWVVDCVEKGTRLSEGPYVPAGVRRRIGGSGQGSVRDMFVKRGFDGGDGEDG